MIIKNPEKAKIKEYCNNLLNLIETSFTLKKTLYLDLGVKKVRLLVYNKEFLSHIEKQMTFVLRENLSSYDATIVLWKETDIEHIYKAIIPELDPKINFKRRIELLTSKKDDALAVAVFDDEHSKVHPLINTDFYNGIVTAIDKNSNTYFYGVRNLEPEEFIKEGHLFVQHINKILKSETSNLAHGALIGVDGNGILFCARGQRGKSTLTVLSMLRGFEYVSDDYLTLEKQGDKLYSYPIYSIITLSPKMYNELFDDLKGSTFISNNARKDKYVFNISNFHKQFKTKYPVKMCIFPEIVDQKAPTITDCTVDEKGRAIAQLIHSTVMQMQDLSNNEIALKLFNMVKDFKFYKLNLCPDIEENTRFLSDFVKNSKWEKDPKPFDKEIIEDITFDLANFVNTKTGVIYSMNKLTTNIYENLKRGVSIKRLTEAIKDIHFEEDILDGLKENKDKNAIIAKLQLAIKFKKEIYSMLDKLTKTLAAHHLWSAATAQDSAKL